MATGISGAGQFAWPDDLPLVAWRRGCVRLRNSVCHICDLKRIRIAARTISTVCDIFVDALIQTLISLRLVIKHEYLVYFVDSALRVELRCLQE